MPSSRLLPIAPWLLPAAALAAPFAAQAATVQVTVLCECYVSAITPDAKAATGTMADTEETFYWTAKHGLKRLGRSTLEVGVIGGSPAISADGKVVAASIVDDTGTVATEGRWTAAGGWQQLAPPLPPDGGEMDGSNSAVYGMSGDGKVITGLYWRPGYHDGSAHGSVWTAKTGMVGLPTDGASARIDGANADGSVLSGWEESPIYGYRQATIWRQGNKVVLSAADAWGEAPWLNAAGDMAVGMDYDQAAQRSAAAMWRWDGSQWQHTSLGVLPNTDANGMAYANGASEDGSVVAGIARLHLSPTTYGFIWAKGKMKEATAYLKKFGFSDPGYSITAVMAVSADGKAFAVTERQNVAPYANRSILVQKQ